MDKVPDNVINKVMYLKIKNKIKNKLKKNGRRWSAYASGQLVKQYKNAGGKYRGKKNNSGLARWFKEKWIRVDKLPKKVKCGRPKQYSTRQYLKDYPLCRPSVKVSKSTPKLASKFTLAQIKKLSKKKKKNPKKRIKF
jgi:hypothetical protein